MKGWITLLGLACLSADCGATTRIRADSFAQELVNESMHAQRAPRVMTLVAVPPGESRSVVIATNRPGELGKPASATAGEVQTSGNPSTRFDSATKELSVTLPLLDVSGDRIGVMELVYSTAAADKDQTQHRATDLRDRLQHRISHVTTLLEPFPYAPHPAVVGYTVGQKIVDQTMQAHPDLLIYMFHTTPPGGAKNIISASSIGRIGKEADEDDLRVVNTGKPNLEVDPAGNRYEVEMPLEDAAGHRIGAQGMVFAYKAGDDAEALHRRGAAIAASVNQQIHSTAQLYEPAK